MGIENIRALEKFIGLRVPQMGEFVAMTINSLFFVCILMRLLFESYANTNSLSSYNMMSPQSTKKQQRTGITLV